jgi:hypothetical protein
LSAAAGCAGEAGPCASGMTILTDIVRVSWRQMEFNDHPRTEVRPIVKCREIAVVCMHSGSLKKSSSHAEKKGGNQVLARPLTKSKARQNSL